MEKLLNLIECSISEEKHIAEKAICLSCGHFICKKCIPLNNNYNFKCLKCTKVNQINVSLCEPTELVQYNIENNLAALLVALNTSIDDELAKLKNLKSTMKEKYHNQIELYRDEVDIRVESLKTELDSFRDEFNKKLDAAEKDIEKEIDGMNDDFEDEKGLGSKVQNNSIEAFYANQEFLKKLKAKNESQKEPFTLDFEISEMSLTAASIGQFSLFSGERSKILSNEEMIALERLVGFSLRNRSLLYRASDHGFEAVKFHEKCDKISNTLTIIKSANGFVFGGFTTTTWDGPDAHKRDDKAFLLSLKNKENKAEKMMVNPAMAQYAVVSNPGLGPTFGQYRRSFCIKDLANQNQASYSNFSTSETYLASSKKSDDYLAGTSEFLVGDIEVYQIPDFK